MRRTQLPTYCNQESFIGPCAFEHSQYVVPTGQTENAKYTVVRTAQGLTISAKTSSIWSNIWHIMMFTVLVGKHKLSDEPLGVAEHWAIGIQIKEVVHWYEIRGASKSEVGALNVIERNTDSTKYTRIKIIGDKEFSGTTEELLLSIVKFNKEWCEKHPRYAVNGGNCQLYVCDLARYFGFKLTTQNSAIGNGSIGAGVGAVMVGIGMVVLGFMLKGPHR